MQAYSQDYTVSNISTRQLMSCCQNLSNSISLTLSEFQLFLKCVNF